MAETTASLGAKGIEEGLIDKVGDAIGGEGSLCVLSGGSAAERHEIIVHVLEEAEGMGCLVATCQCDRAGPDEEVLVGSLVGLAGNVDGLDVTSIPSISDRVSLTDRSYKREMALLGMLRGLADGNTVVIALEEMGKASVVTVNTFSFLARNIGGMNVLMIATAGSFQDDPLLAGKLEDLKRDVLVHDIHIHAADGADVPGIQPVVHVAVGKTGGPAIEDETSVTISRIKDHLRASCDIMASGNTAGSVSEAGSALESAVALGHHGLVLDSCIASGVALTQAGQERKALEMLDGAICLAKTLGEVSSQYTARVRRAELMLFSVGEPDSTSMEAAITYEITSHTLGAPFNIGPLALTAIVEAGNGRKDRSENAFCEASQLLERQPIDLFYLERMLLAMAAATLMERDHNLVEMGKRYGEAHVLASGTDRPGHWTAVVSLTHGLSLLNLKSPNEARPHLDEAFHGYDRLGNAVQSSRARRLMEESEVGIMPD